MITIIDFGMGNLHSILHKLQKIGVKAIISSHPEDIEKATKLILPGVGAFGAGMQKLQELNLIPVLNYKVLEQKTPILGICLGMQLFAKKSQEGNAKGLEWIDASVQRFDFVELSPTPRIPHVGWNILSPQRENLLIEGIETQQRFYFTHSYHLVSEVKDIILTTSLYGYHFISAIHQENIYGVQFHPEKSHRRGLIIYQNFIEKA